MLIRRGFRSSVYLNESDDVVRVYHDTGDAQLVPEACKRRACTRCAAPPPHLRRALRCMIDARDVTHFARRCGVAESTAWSYATRIVECWPAAESVAIALVYEPLVRALHECSDISGPLRDVMGRVEGAVAGDHEWRTLRDRYAHLRLGRVCVDARRSVRRNASRRGGSARRSRSPCSPRRSR